MNKSIKEDKPLQSKKEESEPLERFMGDDGENWLILSNGGITLQERYNALWKGNKISYNNINLNQFKS